MSLAWNLKQPFICLTAACVIFVLLYMALLTRHYDMTIKFKVMNRDGWTPLYTEADRLSMGSQPNPNLDNIFWPKCPLDLPCIAVGTGWFGHHRDWGFFARTLHNQTKPCPHQCHFVSDVSQADVVLFHGRDLPDRLLWKRHPHQVWIYLNMESPIATKALGYNVAGNPYYHQLFNWTATYQPGSIAQAPYNRVVPRTAASGAVPKLPDLSLKKRLAYMVFSNCGYTFNGRRDVVRRLQSVMELDVYGKCGSLQVPYKSDAFRQLGKKYYFYLSFENAFCKDYITEKFFANALDTDAAPVAIGGMSRSDYDAAAPAGSFVYGPDFPSARALANHLRGLASNSSAYLTMFAWRATHELNNEHLMCGACSAIHSGLNLSSAGVVTHLSGYYSVETNCRPASYSYLV